MRVSPSGRREATAPGLRRRRSIGTAPQTAPRPGQSAAQSRRNRPRGPRREAAAGTGGPVEDGARLHGIVVARQQNDRPAPACPTREHFAKPCHQSSQVRACRRCLRPTARRRRRTARRPTGSARRHPAARARASGDRRARAEPNSSPRCRSAVCSSFSMRAPAISNRTSSTAYDLGPAEPPREQPFPPLRDTPRRRRPRGARSAARPPRAP